MAVLALAFGAATPVYAAAAPAVSHVAGVVADGPSAGDSGPWAAPRHHRHHHGWSRDDRDGRGHRWGHRWGRAHGPVGAGGGAMASSVASLTQHIGG
ncbi:MULTISPECIES: hypothetical protein [Streptacidiphilus]|uniref:Uncharacterized protein n=2 Tax=Streptacidiphilus TaxID=228398 RepID=A0ABV6UEG6_9ACTN|nr:hypothetical protein [Streptacidiphilus jeojiense]